jgi:hypothetical protein
MRNFDRFIESAHSILVKQRPAVMKNIVHVALNETSEDVTHCLQTLLRQTVFFIFIFIVLTSGILCGKLNYYVLFVHFYNTKYLIINFDSEPTHVSIIRS